MYLKWDDRYSVGIETFDHQHKQLFEIINTLFTYIKARNILKAASKGAVNKKPLEETLNELLNYTKIHFNAEELEMLSHGYPGYEKHKKEHDEFASRVADFILRVNRGEAVLTAEVLNSLVNWLDHHMYGTDKLYSPFLTSKGVK